VIGARSPRIGNILLELSLDAVKWIVSTTIVSLLLSLFFSFPFPRCIVVYNNPRANHLLLFSFLEADTELACNGQSFWRFLAPNFARQAVGIRSTQNVSDDGITGSGTVKETGLEIELLEKAMLRCGLAELVDVTIYHIDRL